MGYPVATSASTPKAVTVSRRGSRIAGVAIDVLERVQPPVAGRHELDDAAWRMTGVPRRFVELRPAAVVGLDLAGQRFDELRHALAGHERAKARGADVIDHGTLASGLVFAASAPRRLKQSGAAVLPIDSQKTDQKESIIEQIVSTLLAICGHHRSQTPVLAARGRAHDGRRHGQGLGRVARHGAKSARASGEGRHRARLHGARSKRPPRISAFALS